MALNTFQSILGSLKHVTARSKVMARADRKLKSDLVRIRRDNGMTQKDVAELLGITQQAITKFERYDSDPKLSTIRRYANAVGVIVSHEVDKDLGQSVRMAELSYWKTPETTPTFRVVKKASRPQAYRTPRAGAWSELQRAELTLSA